ncbi:hypothetical protein AKO1_015402 [Acrasis kona]|uniref:Basic immunoglobulin-like variable motif-containing protein n=1 Tax=Acrasis kona TaxID=1008807 RepID=A0AAW2YQY8_9EUKA
MEKSHLPILFSLTIGFALGYIFKRPPQIDIPQKSEKSLVEDFDSQEDELSYDQDNYITPEGIVVPKKKDKKPPGDKTLNSKRKPRSVEDVLKESGKEELLSDPEKCKQFGEELSNILLQRKHLDYKRWLCISRSQYRFSCGISSLTGVWNYLFSTLGNGNLPPLSQEEVLSILGFDKPYADIRFGPFTGNGTVIGWFNELCKHFNVEGQAGYFWKVHQPAKTFGMNDEKAKKLLREGLQDQNKAFIYHCHNHYMVPIGFEDSPLNPEHAYITIDDSEFSNQEKINLNASVMDNDEAEDADVMNNKGVRTWIMVGDTSKTNKAIHCIKFEDIAKDLHSTGAEYYNIRHLEYGTLNRKKPVAGNINCIMVFSKTGGDVTRTPIRKKKIKKSLRKVAKETADELENFVVEK